MAGKRQALWKTGPRHVAARQAAARLAAVLLVTSLLVATLMAGCRSLGLDPAATPSPAPTLTPIFVRYTPALRPLETALQTCAGRMPEIALFTEEQPASHLPGVPEPGAVHLRLGEPAGPIAYAAVLGEIQAAVILHPDNPLSELSAAEVAALFTRPEAGWESIGGPDAPVHLYILPEGDEIRELVDATLLEGAEISPLAGIAADPEHMLQRVAEDPNAIGYLPENWLTDTVKALPIEDTGSAELRLPILALAPEEPEGLTASLLSCLQSQ